MVESHMLVKGDRVVEIEASAENLLTRAGGLPVKGLVEVRTSEMIP